MSIPLRVLLIEDSEEDARLLLRELRRGGYEVSSRRVNTPAAMEAALEEESWDVILSEHSVPFFGALAALELLQSRGLDLPFIVVSGRIGEDRAVAVMRAGAHDYISKDNLLRLNPAIARELREAETRRERRQAEETLRASEKRLRALVENSSDMVILLASDATILYTNSSVRRVLGHAPGEFAGQGGLELVHPEDRKLVESKLAELVREPDKMLAVEVRIWHSDGSWRWVEAVGTNLLADPNVGAIIVNARDVTERKEAEEELRRSEERFRRVVEQAADAFFVHDLEGRFVDVNRQTCESLGYTREELLNMSVPDVEVDFTPGVLEKVWKKVVSGAPLTLRGTHRRKDGTIFPVELRLGVFESEGRRLMLALARDVTERERAEEALRISEARFRTIIEQSPLSIQVLSPDGRTLEVNRAWEELWGVTFEDIKGYNLLEDQLLVDKGIMPYIQRGFAGEPSLIPPMVYDSDEIIPGVKRNEGLERWIRAFIYPVKDEAGDVREVVLIYEDITERTRAEEALRESEERIRRVIANAPVSLFALNREGVFTLAEGRALEALGFQPEQIVGMSIFEVYRDEPEILAHALHALGGEELSSIHVVTALGLVFEVRWSPVRDQSGGVTGVIGVATDITERKRAEEALRESEQRFRSLVRNASDIITVLGPDGAVLYQSPATERVLGYWPEEMVGKNLFDYVHPEDLEHLSDVLEEVRDNWGVQANTELRFQHADGSWCYLEVVANNLLNEPSVAGIVLNSRDITERNQAEEALRNSLGMLLALYEASQVLISTPGLKETGVRLLEIMRWVSGLTAAILSLRDERGRLQAWEATGPEEVWGPAHDTPEAQVACRSVSEDGAPQVFHPQQSNPEAPPVGLCLPLLARGRIIGTLEVFGPDSLVEKETLEILNSLASLAGSALENARLYGELADREKQLESLIGKLLATQEEERRRVAYEVHDGLAQVAATAHQRLQAFARRNPPSTEKSRQDLDRVLKLVRQTVGEARRIIANLRPEVLDDLGLAVALRQEVDELREEGWQVEYEEELGDERLPVSVETTLFRVAQEALTNTRKHAQTQRARLELRRREGEVSLKIRDWGRGFDLDDALDNGDGPGQRVGISGMRERVGLLGGEFEICSRLGEGTSITIWVPLSALAGDDQEDKHVGR